MGREGGTFPVDQPAVQLSLHCDLEGAKQYEGGWDFLRVLRNRVGVQYGHLVGRIGLSVGLVLAGGAAHCGSTGGWCGCGRGGRRADSGAGHAAAAGGGGGSDGGGTSATRSRRHGLLFFGLLTGELGDAEDELEAPQFDVAAMVEQGGAFPARPAATN